MNHFLCDGCGAKVEYTESFFSSVDFSAFYDDGEPVGVADAAFGGQFCQDCHDKNFDLSEIYEEGTA